MIANTQPNAGDLKSFVDGLITLAGRLVSLLEQETALLRAMRPGEIGALQEEKLRLIRGYESMAGELRANPSRLATVSEAVRGELRTAVQSFEEATAQNTRALSAAQEANERLLKAIVDAAAEQSGDMPVYAKDGGLRKNGNATSTGVSLSLNEEL